MILRIILAFKSVARDLVNGHVNQIVNDTANDMPMILSWILSMLLDFNSLIDDHVTNIVNARDNGLANGHVSDLLRILGLQIISQ